MEIHFGKCPGRVKRYYRLRGLLSINAVLACAFWKEQWSPNFSLDVYRNPFFPNFSSLRKASFFSGFLVHSRMNERCLSSSVDGETGNNTVVWFFVFVCFRLLICGCSGSWRVVSSFKSRRKSWVEKKAAALLLDEGGTNKERISLVTHFFCLIKTEIEIHQRPFFVVWRFDDSNPYKSKRNR